jgi:hypothetical protein
VIGAVPAKLRGPAGSVKRWGVIAEFAEDADAEYGAQAGQAGDDRYLRVLLEQVGEFGLKCGVAQGGTRLPLSAALSGMLEVRSRTSERCRCCWARKRS